MFQRPGLFLMLTSIFLFLTSWMVSWQATYAQTATATPSPTPTATPTSSASGVPLGVNFWDPGMVTDANIRLFANGGPGYVLLLYETVSRPDDTQLQAVLDADLTPIIRYSNPGSIPPAQSWIDDLGNFIVAHPQVELYVIGNEPNHPSERRDRPFTPVEYAIAYAQLWHEIHDTNRRNISVDDASLLVAGPATHRRDTTTWLLEVSNEIADREAQVDGYAIHAYGFGLEYDASNWVRPTVNVNSTPVAVPNIGQALRGPGNINIVNCPTPWAANQSCRNVGATWPEREHGFLVYQQQIESIPAIFANRPVYITEVNTFAWGSGDTTNPILSYPPDDPQRWPISPYVPANNYPIGWISQAVQSVNAYNTAHPTQQVEGLLWFTGENSPDSTEWQRFALTSDIGRLDCARADFQSLTRGGPRRPCDPTAFAPSLEAGPYCNEQGKVVGISTTISGQGLTLDKLFVTASPTDPYDVSGYDPDSHHTLILDKVPPVGGYATVMLSNQAGLITQQRVYNKGCKNGSSGAGGDHPDDNQSAASGLLLAGQAFTLPAGARAVPQVAIVNRGFTGSLWQALNQLGEPSVLLDDDFDPTATIRQYPILIIPSGGLYGVENSVVFKRRLELYAEAGGTIVAFAQQHGYEFNALPGAVGGQGSGGAGEISPPLSGYGWQEDNSCYEASLLLSANHPSLSGFSQTALTAHVDGYFSTVPTNTTTLLTRNQNGAPGTILYPYGQGQVIATGMYDDWGAANGQLSADAQTFLRDLVSWAVEPTDIPTYAPGTAVNLSAAVTNNTENEAVAVRLSLINPAREIVGTQIVTTTLTPDASANLTFDASPLLPSPSAPLLGIWRLDATLLSGRGLPIGPRMPVNRFAIANPPQTTASNRPFDLNITAWLTDRFNIEKGQEVSKQVASH